MNETKSSSSDVQTILATLQQFLSQHPLLGTLESAELRELAGTMDLLELQSGEILFRQDDPGDSVYLVAEGGLEARVDAERGGGIQFRRLQAGDIVGEIAVLTGQRRTATIAASERTRLVQLSKETFARLSEQYPQMIEKLSRQVLPRLRLVQLVSILKNLFGDNDMPAIQEIEDRLIWKRLSPGEILFRQGEPADSLYIVISGRLRIAVKDGGHEERLIGEVSRGEFTGEFGLITNEPRSATVYAVRDSEVVQLSQPLFEYLWARHAPAMLQFTRLIVQRVGRFNQTPAARRPTFSAIAVVPTNPSVPVEDFSAKLFESLSRQGTALHLSSASFDDLYGRPGAAQTSIDHPSAVLIRGWLAEKESQQQYVLYQADRTLTQWTRRCLRQADRILLVGQAGTNPDPGEIEQAFAGLNLLASQDLVLIQPEASSCANGTRRWLAGRKISSPYHVRTGIPQDFQRLARRLTGKATGLVLSGGGARGWAHVGVIQALEEAGVEIDLIGGTSMGSLISGAYAAGLSIADMLDLAKAFSAPEKLLDYTLPFTSLTTSRKVSELMHHIFGDTQIEDLCLPFFCVSSNLTRAEPMVHSSGPLWEAVRASIAIPGIFSPMPFGADVLVDGGIMNNFPIDIMRALCEDGFVIGVNAAPKLERYRDFSFGPSVSGWRVLWGKLFHFGKKIKAPSIAASLIRATEINSLYHLRSTHDLADLVIEPPVSQFEALEFKRYKEIVEIGYQTAKEKWDADKRT